jgi:hypothetical protein
MVRQVYFTKQCFEHDESIWRATRPSEEQTTCRKYYARRCKLAMLPAHPAGTADFLDAASLVPCMPGATSRHEWHSGR